MSHTRHPAVTTRMMAAVKGKDSRAELMLRKRLWARGLRYRKHHAGLVGHPDIVFLAARVIVFVDGDFWHGNAWRLRGLASLADLFPNRADWWVRKIERTVQRDREVTDALAADGWLVIRVWESRIRREADIVAAEVESLVRSIPRNRPKDPTGAGRR